MKTSADLHREIAAAYDMIEGTDLTVSQCFKHAGDKGRNFAFNDSPELYELCLAIVEGKPVFSGDYLWMPNLPVAQYVSNIWSYSDFKVASWNPPKPKTVMVELLREDAVEMSLYKVSFSKISAACKKALEEQ